MRINRSLLVTVTVAGLIVTACSSGADAHSAASSGSAASVDLSGVTLTIGQTTPTTDLIFAASGAFSGTPYKIKWANFTTPSDQVQALNAGAIDVSTLGDTSLTFVQGNATTPWTTANRPLVNVAYRTQVNPNAQGLVAVVRADSSIKTLADLKGKKFAYNSGGTVEALYALTLKKAGLTKADITPVQLPQAQGFTSLVHGDVDAWVGGAATAQPLVASGQLRILTSSGQVGQSNGLSIAVKPALLKNAAKTAALKDWLSRAVQADIWTSQHLEQAAQITSDKTKQKYADALAAIKDSGGTEFVPITSAVLNLQQQGADALTAVGSLASKVDVSIQYDDEFNSVIDAAIKKSGVAAPALPSGSTGS